MTHDQRVYLLALAGAAPGALVALWILWTGDYSARVQWTFTLLIGGSALACASAIRQRVVLPLQTISNLLAALRESDFSVRARRAPDSDPLGAVASEVNALADTLRGQRLDAVEATALLQKVMAEIEVAVFTFDGNRHLQLVNREGARLLGRPVERLLGRSASDLGLDAGLADDATRTLQMTFPGGGGRWEVRKTTFRQHGLPHQLLVMTDVSQSLREEERQAWKRLIRVIGHEMNNSLTPIKSIAGSLATLTTGDRPASDWRDDLRHGLAIISGRAEALSRFMTAYARLARLPPPTLAPIPLSDCVQRVAGLDAEHPVDVLHGPDVIVRGDRDQLEQLLINLVRNAHEASAETGGGVRVGWDRNGDAAGPVTLWVEDDGPGLPQTGNLFVPFFTTKPDGSGIGLVLCRQIAEAHGGTLTLSNRDTGRGCRATLTLPAHPS